jgi:hypothetical protein
MGYQARARSARRAADAVRLCVYCGAAPGTTQDHVPPKTLFPKPRPPLVTVPCCEPCRHAQSKDDEYFKSRIALRHDVADGPLGNRVTDSVLRAFARPQARGFATGLLQSMREVEVRTAAGLYLGHVMTYHADLRRLDAVMRRTLLGLYYHETRERLPATHHALAYSIDGLSGVGADAQGALERLVQFAMTGWRRVVARDVFAYVFQGIPGAPHCSVWVMLVYKRVLFLGFTLRRDDLP